MPLAHEESVSIIIQVKGPVATGTVCVSLVVAVHSSRHLCPRLADAIVRSADSSNGTGVVRYPEREGIVESISSVLTPSSRHKGYRRSPEHLEDYSS